MVNIIPRKTGAKSESEFLASIAPMIDETDFQGCFFQNCLIGTIRSIK